MCSSDLRRRLPEGLPGADRVIVPGRCRGDVEGLATHFGVPVLRGPDELKDAMVTLHPQSAMEHLHHRFTLADGHGSDGALAIEATEVSPTRQTTTLIPVRPNEPLAGLPDRSPIPLADTVTGGLSAVQASAQKAQAAAGGLFERVVTRVQDVLPIKPASGYRTVKIGRAHV